MVVIAIIGIILGGSLLDKNIIDKDVYLDHSLCDAANIFDTSISSHYVGLKTLPDTLVTLKNRGYIAQSIDLTKFEYSVNGDGSGYMLYALLSDGTKYLSPGSHFYEPPHFVEFTVPGTYTFTLPVGITSFDVEVVSGGGGGGKAFYGLPPGNGTDKVNYGGGGGGTGAYGSLTGITDFDQTTALTIVVGAGGSFSTGTGLAATGQNSSLQFKTTSGSTINLYCSGGYGGTDAVSTGAGWGGMAGQAPGFCGVLPGTSSIVDGPAGNGGSASGGTGATIKILQIPISSSIPRLYGNGGEGQSVTSTGVYSGGTPGSSGIVRINWH